jgi:hypothetical protein
MLFALSFTGKPGKENALQAVLGDLETIRRVAALMGATLEAVFLQGSRFTEIFDLPGAQPTLARSRLLEAHGHPEVHSFLERIAPLLDDPFDPEDPTSFAAWVQRHKLRLVVDARLPEAGGAEGSSPALAIGAAPR